MARGAVKTEILIEDVAWRAAWPTLRADIRALVVPARPERGVCAAKITVLSIS